MNRDFYTFGSNPEALLNKATRYKGRDAEITLRDGTVVKGTIEYTHYDSETVKHHGVVIDGRNYLVNKGDEKDLVDIRVLPDK